MADFTDEANLEEEGDEWEEEDEEEEEEEEDEEDDDLDEHSEEDEMVEVEGNENVGVNVPPQNRGGYSEEQGSALSWSGRMIRTGQPTRDEANRLVLEYLMVSGFREAAEEFAREAGLAADVGSMAGREEARNLLLRGDVLSCVRLLDALDPHILEKDSLLLFDLYQQHFVELLLAGGEAGGGAVALQFAQEHLLPLVLRDPALLRKVERLMGLVAFSAPPTLHLVLSSAAAAGSRRSPDSVTAPATLPAHLSYMREALDGQRRVELAGRVNQAMLVSGGLSSQPELPGMLRSVKHLQQRHLREAGGGRGRPLACLSS